MHTLSNNYCHDQDFELAIFGSYLHASSLVAYNTQNLDGM